MIIVSGLSGAGKTIALHALEDLGYYCIDNLPSNLLDALHEERLKLELPVAVGIDIRNQIESFNKLPQSIKKFKAKTPTTKILFLTAQYQVLLRRFNETQRKHPLAKPEDTLDESILKEINILSPINTIADYQIDTSQLSVYDLKDRIKSWLKHRNSGDTTLTIESFGFKNSSPIDADIMFDVRFLPNPYWESELRHYTGKEKPVQQYLEKFDLPKKFINDTANYLSQWLPNYLNGHRSYLTVAIGCTGGKHRSVYVAEKIAKKLAKNFGHINIRHRDLPKKTP